LSCAGWDAIPALPSGKQAGIVTPAYGLVDCHKSSDVIPAKAGIHPECEARGKDQRSMLSIARDLEWIPAFAGMTIRFEREPP
jgi:hypothetical protein